jgi:ribosomal-protein-alanine N-acetyltransferase
MNPDRDAFQVRFMTAADLDRVTEIAASLREAPQWPREAYAAALTPDATPRRIALVAEHRSTGSLAGFAVVSLMPPESELESIAVDTALQRRGVARALWAALPDVLQGAEVGQIRLEVRASNGRAQAFYRALGFAEDGRRARYYVDPVEDAVIMCRALP